MKRTIAETPNFGSNIAPPKKYGPVKQTVVRTDEDSFEGLKKLLEKGWRVIYATRMRRYEHDSIEYILEKEAKQ